MIDDRILAMLLIVIGAIRILIAVAGHQVFGGEATIAMFMVWLGLWALLRSYRPRQPQ